MKQTTIENINNFLNLTKHFSLFMIFLGTIILFIWGRKNKGYRYIGLSLYGLALSFFSWRLTLILTGPILYFLLFSIVLFLMLFIIGFSIGILELKLDIDLPNI